MTVWSRRLLKIIAGICLVFILLWIGLVVFVRINKQKLVATVTRQINEEIDGRLIIGDVDLTLLRHFPGISVSLSNVSLRDSLYPVHKHELLKAENLDVSLNVFSLIKGAPQINNVTIDNGAVYLFIDSTGYSNAHMFQRKEDKDHNKRQPHINHLTLTKVNFVFQNQTKFKFFQIHVNKMEGLLHYNASGWTADIDADAFIDDFTFNTVKGSFLKSKHLRAALNLGYSSADKKLNVPLQRIRLDNDVLLLGATFLFDRKPALFSLSVHTNGIKYNNALSFLSPNIYTKLKVIDFTDPIALNASIKGRIKFRDTPLVRVAWNIRNNTFITPGGAIKECSFQGRFSNGIDPAKGHNDHNSQISLSGFHGKWNDIAFRADSVRINDLIDPKLEARFTSDFSLKKVNKIIGSRTFSITDGNADFNLLYKGGLRDADTTAPYLKGYFRIKDLGMVYTPRNLQFNKSDITLLFTGSDLFIKDGRLHSRSSTLYLNGVVRNFLNLYYTAPEKILLDWKIRSPRINVDEFESFLAARDVGKKASEVKINNKKLQRTTAQLDQILDKSSVHLDMSIDQLLYRQFRATDIRADVLLAQSVITLNKVNFNHAGGKLQISADIVQKDNNNDVNLKADIDKVDVQRFFKAMENFGQDAITAQNLQGYLYANADVHTSISGKGKIQPHSLHGAVSFNVKDGALIDFEPIQRIGNIIFRNRNLEYITFKDVKNTLDLKGDKIIINPMHIESSALTLNVEGVYGLQKGTDILIDVPLRNPKKDEMILNDSLRAARSMKGIVLHFNAVDGDDGKVKIKLMMKRKDVFGKNDSD